ncbi:response regulator transcription factor [Pararhodobacter sp.]
MAAGRSGVEVPDPRRHVVVVEDEANISEAIRFLLRRDGFEVSVHADGESALRALSERRPDLVILDIMLPGLGGYDVLRALRARPGCADLPVIMLSAKGQAAARDQAQAAGASLFMSKPFANAELVAAVRGLLEG